MRYRWVRSYLAARFGLIDAALGLLGVWLGIFFKFFPIFFKKIHLAAALAKIGGFLTRPSAV